MSKQVHFKIAVSPIIGSTALNPVMVTPNVNVSIGGGKMIWAQDDLLPSTTQTKTKLHPHLSATRVTVLESSKTTYLHFQMNPM